MQRHHDFIARLDLLSNDPLCEEWSEQLQQNRFFPDVCRSLLTVRPITLNRPIPANETLLLDASLVDATSSALAAEARELQISECRASNALKKMLSRSDIPLSEEDVLLALCRVQRQYVPATQALIRAALRLRIDGSSDRMEDTDQDRWVGPIQV